MKLSLGEKAAFVAAEMLMEKGSSNEEAQAKVVEWLEKNKVLIQLGMDKLAAVKMFKDLGISVDEMNAKLAKEKSK